VQCAIEIVHAKKQKETIAGPGAVRTGKSRMLVGTPLVQGKQDRFVRVKNLPEVIVRGCRGRESEE
jgi:hypothetical protein